MPSGARSKQGRLADGSYGNRSEAKARKVNIRFDLPRGIDGLAAYFSEFLEIAGGTRWWKRVDQIYREGQKSSYQAKIMSDHHWLELELSTQIGIWREHGRLLPEEVFPQSMAALLFAGMTAETHKHLTTTGRNNLLGRLRDGLKTDFAGLYLELDVARGLLDEGFDIEFPDFEGAATYDIRFQNGNIVGEVECKSLSADAGRKIHRKDFYRFIDALGPKVMDYAKNSTRAVLVVTLDDRMLPDVESQRALRTAASRVLTEANLTQLSGPNFVIEREPYERRLANTDFTEPKELYDACSKAFGPNCHASGVMSETGGCFVVVRSRREDDHSKPQLEALKKATSQLTGNHPGFIALQFEDIAPPDLALPHLRRRVAILANAVFHSKDSSHLAAVYHTAYGGLHPAGGLLAKPAFVFWNPRWDGSADGLPFRSGMSNSEFALKLGVDPGKTDPDDHMYGLGD